MNIANRQLKKSQWTQLDKKNKDLLYRLSSNIHFLCKKKLMALKFFEFFELIIIEMFW